MKIKRILSAVVIIISMTLLIISLLWKSQETKSSSNLYESRRPIQNDFYYIDSIISEPTPTPIDDNDKSTTVTPTPIIVGEKELVSIFSSDLKIEKKIDKHVIKNRWNIELTDDEIDLLAKIVWIESRGESDKGQRAVVEVIFNRMIHWDFEGSLCDVLSADGQFCSWPNRNEAEPTEKEYKNIKKVLDGKTEILGCNKVYFSTSPRNDMNPIHIGGHWFCEYEITKR